MNNEVFENRNSRIWLSEEGIIHQVLKRNAEQTVADAQEDMKIYSQLCSSKKRPTLIDISQVRSITREARLFYSRELAVKYNTAMVLVTETKLSRVIANFMLGLTKPAIPIRLFTDKNKGLKWLQRYV